MRCGRAELLDGARLSAVFAKQSQFTFRSARLRRLVAPFNKRRSDGRRFAAEAAVAPTLTVNRDQLEGARNDLAALVKSKFCNPILVRLAWHDAGTYNKVRLTVTCGVARI